MEKIYDEEEIAYEHEIFIYDYSNEMGGGGLPKISLLSSKEMM